MMVTASLLDSRYSIDEEIGAGGFCEVWRATDTVLARPVAVKLLHAAYAFQPEARARFKAEARLAGALSHENVARVYDYGEPASGQSYLVMELIEGPSLATVLAGGPLDAARTMDIVAQVAAGLQAAHSAGLVHRDIKPANILFTSEGCVRITDFGIAHAIGSAPLTATGIVVGTAGYIAPERVAGAAAGPASDLYALGVVAFECLAGAPPFSGPALEVAIAHRDRPLPPLPPALPAEVADFVTVLTAKNPVWRPASAGEVAHQACQLRDRIISGAISQRPACAGVPLAVVNAAQGRQGQGLVRDRTRNGLPLRPGTLGAAALVGLAALACLMLLTVSGFALTSHPPVRPSTAPSVTKSSPAHPVPTQPAGQQSSAPPNAGAGAVAAVKPKPARHHFPLRPGPDYRQNRPGKEGGGHHGAGNGPGTGHGRAPGRGHGSGNGPGPGDGNNQLQAW